MSSENTTSGLRLSGRYTSARNVVISSRRCRPCDSPTVPKRWPCSQTASAHGRTSALHDVGAGVGGEVDVDVLVVAPRAIEERVAHAAADEVALVARVGQQARELLRGRRRVEQRPEAGRDRGHRHHSRRPESGHRAKQCAPASLRPRAHRSGTVRREWTAPSPARGSAAASPRSRCSPSTPASASCGSTRSRHPGRGAGVLCDAHADRLSPPRGLEPPRPSRRRVAAVDRAAAARREPPVTPRRAPAARATDPPTSPAQPGATVAAASTRVEPVARRARRDRPGARAHPVVAARPARAPSSSACSTPARRCSRARSKPARPTYDD